MMLVLGAGASRRQITRTLHAAYADGLLSEDTFSSRLDELLRSRLIDPSRLIGDLTLRIRHRDLRARLLSTIGMAWRRTRTIMLDQEPPLLLALDWTGGQYQLVIGRHGDCDVVLTDMTVSRHHTRLVFRDGAWIVHDLESRNGTVLNSRSVKRCEVRPGDRLTLGDVELQVD
ncbi:MAG TPA: FHA domain-containing protein [Solirubrobacteraceae bacterium]